MYCVSEGGCRKGDEEPEVGHVLERGCHVEEPHLAIWKV